MATYISNIELLARRQDVRSRVKFTSDITGTAPKMFGSSIVGFGKYTYHRRNGDQGTYLATGSSIRKSGSTIDILPGYKIYQPLLANLGPHKLANACLYLKSLQDIDLGALRGRIRRGLGDLAQSHEVRMG